jgi:hypothetical protein
MGALNRICAGLSKQLLTKIMFRVIAQTRRASPELFVIFLAELLRTANGAFQGNCTTRSKAVSEMAGTTVLP